MNLVIDDAYEVKQPTKTDPEESRRSLGMTLATCLPLQQEIAKLTFAQAKSFSRVTMSLSSKTCHDRRERATTIRPGRASNTAHTKKDYMCNGVFGVIRRGVEKMNWMTLPHERGKSSLDSDWASPTITASTFQSHESVGRRNGEGSSCSARANPTMIRVSQSRVQRIERSKWETTYPEKASSLHGLLCCLLKCTS